MLFSVYLLRLGALRPSLGQKSGGGGGGGQENCSLRPREWSMLHPKVDTSNQRYLLFF